MKGKLLSSKAGPRISGGGSSAHTFTAPKKGGPASTDRFVPKKMPKKC